MASGRRRRPTSIEQRRRLRHEATVEAAVARAAGLNVRDQIQMARNASVWGAGLIGLAALVLMPNTIGDPSSVWGIAEAVTAVPAAVLVRRSWMLQRGLRELDAGDDEMAHLRQLVRSLDSRPAIKAGREALAAAEQGFEERRRVLERRGHVEALLIDTNPQVSEEALAAGLASCNAELVEIDRQLQGLVMAVAHLASSSDQSRAAAVSHVRDAADGVNALASGFDELRSPD